NPGRFTLARKAATILSHDHLSPHGEKRKLQLLESIEHKTHVQLVEQAQAGKVNYHETFLGGCSKPGVPCPLGGLSNISSCLGFGSGMACEWVTVDRNKRPVIAQLVRLLTDRVNPENEGSMLNQSLKAQIESATRALDVLDAE